MQAALRRPSLGADAEAWASSQSNLVDILDGQAQIGQKDAARIAAFGSVLVDRRVGQRRAVLSGD